MHLKILFFASLREALGTAALELEMPAPAVVADLLGVLADRGGSWQQLTTFRHLRCAVNQEMARFDAPLAEGDEVAFFPPVTGG